MHFRTTFVSLLLWLKQRNTGQSLLIKITLKISNEAREKVKEKIFWIFLLIEEVQHVPETYLKHLEGTDGLYEIRIQFASDVFRIFCFFDEGKLVVLANGFQKKTQKTPKTEIVKALKIKEEYYENKK